MSEGEAETTDAAPAAEKSGNAVLRTVITFGSIVAVVGVLSYLSTLDAPPNLPANEVHKFRFNTNGELVGLASEAAPDEPAVAHASGLKYDKKGIEKRVSAQCITCHGAPVDPETKQPMDLSSHACVGLGKCVPVGNHPPKNECIKCHRHAGDG